MPTCPTVAAALAVVVLLHAYAQGANAQPSFKDCQSRKLCGDKKLCVANSRTDPSKGFKCKSDPCNSVKCAAPDCCQSKTNTAGSFIGYECVNKCDLVKCTTDSQCLNRKDNKGKCMGATCVKTNPCQPSPCADGQNCKPILDARGMMVPEKYQCIDPCKDPQTCKPGTCCYTKRNTAGIFEAVCGEDPCKPDTCPAGKNCVAVSSKDACRPTCVEPCIKPGVDCTAGGRDGCCRPRRVSDTFGPDMWGPSCETPCALIRCLPGYTCKTLKDKYGRCLGTQCVSPCDPSPCGKYENCEITMLTGTQTPAMDPMTGLAAFSCVNPCEQWGKSCKKGMCCRPRWNATADRFEHSCINPCFKKICKWPTPFCKPLVDPRNGMCQGSKCVGWPCDAAPCGAVDDGAVSCRDLRPNDWYLPTAPTTPTTTDAATGLITRIIPAPEPTSEEEAPALDLASERYTCGTCPPGHEPVPFPAVNATRVISTVAAAAVGSLEEGLLMRLLNVSGGGGVPTIRCIPGVEACKRDLLCGRNSEAECAPAPPAAELSRLAPDVDASGGVAGVAEALELKHGFVCNRNPCETIRCAQPNCCRPTTNKWGLYTGFNCVNPCNNFFCKKPLFCRAETDKIGQCIGACCVNPCASKPCPPKSTCRPRFNDFGVIANEYDCVSTVPPNPCTNPATAISCANNGCCQPLQIAPNQWVASCAYPCSGPFATCHDPSALCKPNTDKFGVCTGGWHCEVISE